MQILITGAGGFVGGHLAGWLARAYPQATLHGTVLSRAERLPDGVHAHEIDLRDPDATHALIDSIQPHQVYHLAAQAFVPLSFEDPWDTLHNNIRSQLNLISASLQMDSAPSMLVVSSAEIYGIVAPDEVPLNERAELRPTSPYSVSKITQDMMAAQYHASHALPLYRARAFNHIGPGQNERFVAPAFAMQIARIEAGLQEPVIYVGDLSDQRDFTDVRDIVRAYQRILESGRAGAAYNVASNQAHSIQALLDGLLALSPVEIRVEVDPARLRPAKLPILQGDYTRLHTHTGWRPEIPFAQSLADILDDCRQRVQAG